MIRSFRGTAPRIAASALVTPVADVLGDILLADGAARWAGTVLQADVLRPLTGEERESLAARFKAAARPVPLT